MLFTCSIYIITISHSVSQVKGRVLIFLRFFNLVILFLRYSLTFHHRLLHTFPLISLRLIAAVFPSPANSISKKPTESHRFHRLLFFLYSHFVLIHLFVRPFLCIPDVLIQLRVKLRISHSKGYRHFQLICVFSEPVLYAFKKRFRAFRFSLSVS